MNIPLSVAINELRNELRNAILEGSEHDIVFTPNALDIELLVSFSTEAKAGGGFKLLTFIDVSTEAKATRAYHHKIKLSVSIADKHGNPIKVMKSGKLPADLLE